MGLALIPAILDDRVRRAVGAHHAIGPAHGPNPLVAFGVVDEILNVYHGSTARTWETVRVEGTGGSTKRSDYNDSEADPNHHPAIHLEPSVLYNYDFVCSLTGYRLTTTESESIVDAAHVHQFSDSRNNDPRNGLALCKNAHWLFDNGLWTMTDDYKVIVAEGRFAEAGPDQKLLRDYHGQRIHLPHDAAHWPNPVHIGWHRKHRFQ